MWTLIAGGFMGWGLGANDAANLFGPAVASRAIRFWTVATLAALFVILGALLMGSRGFATYGAIGTQTLLSSFIIMTAAAFTVILMTLLASRFRARRRRWEQSLGEACSRQEG